MAVIMKSCEERRGARAKRGTFCMFACGCPLLGTELSVCLPVTVPFRAQNFLYVCLACPLPGTELSVCLHLTVPFRAQLSHPTPPYARPAHFHSGTTFRFLVKISCSLRCDRGKEWEGEGRGSVPLFQLDL